MERSARRRTGSFTTPRPLAARLVRRVLEPLVAGRTREQVLGLRVLDPACGDGALLAAAREILGEGSERCLCGVDTDPGALERAARSLGPIDLRRGDALVMDWGGERFDAVVGNPPWISYSGRHAKKLDERTRRTYAGRFETFQGWPSLHGLFLELAVRLSCGRVGFLLPAQVCDLEGYGPVRAFLRRHGRVEEPCEQHGEEAFPGVVQPCCSIILRCDAGGMPGGAAPLALCGVREPAGPRVPDGVFADIGVHTGNCSKELIGSAGAPIREGKDVTPYRLAEPRRTILADRPKREGEYYSIKPLEAYCAVPILLRQTASRPIAALHVEPTYFRNSVLACRGIPGVPHETVVAWLNSSAVAEFHRGAVREAGQSSFPQLKIRHLRNLPVPRWDELGDELHELARAVARDGRLDLARDLDSLFSAVPRTPMRRRNYPL